MLLVPVGRRPFVGRQRELTSLDDFRRAGDSNHGSLVLIAGEPGIGKTRLLREFQRTAGGGRRRTIASSECLESAAAPFGAVRSLLDALLASQSFAGDLPPLVRRALQQLLPDRFGGRARNEAQDAPALEEADLFAGLLAFLKAVALERATILTIEDLHWADASTLEFLSYLASRIAAMRLLVVMTYRSDDVTFGALPSDVMNRLKGEKAVRCIELEPLPHDQLRALIAGALEAPTELAPEIAQRVEASSQGNPLFAEELLKSALEPISGSALPMSIRALVRERVEQLDDAERRVLTHAAVLGPRFDPLVLSALDEGGAASLLPALRRACDLNLLVAEDGPGVRYRFRHALTQQIVYDDLLLIDARSLHERVLALLEASPQAAARLDELAYHAVRAADTAKTLTYNERAGDAAFDTRALADAAARFEHAFGAASGEEDRVRLMEKLGRIARITGDLDRSTSLTKAALEIRLGRREFDLAAVLAVEVGLDRTHRGARAAAELETFYDAHHARLSEGARNRLLATIGRFATNEYDFATATRAFAGLAPLAQLEPRVRLYYWQGSLVIAACRGDRTAWREAARGLRGDLPAFGPLAGAVALTTLAQTALSFGENDEAESAYLDALARAQEWGDHPIQTFTRAFEALYLYLRGRLAEARTALERALVPPHVPVAMTLLGTSGPLIALALDDPELARRCIALVDGLISRERGDMNCVDAANLGAMAAWRAAHGERAQAQSDSLLALEGMTFTDGCTTALPTAARLVPEDALERVRRVARDAANARDNPVARAVHRQVEAIAAARAGNEGASVQHATAAAEAYRAVCWPLLEAQNRELAGDSAAALALYRDCGSVFDVRRLGGDATLLEPAAVAKSALSARESEIADLVASGLTNAGIAERLAVNHKTVEKHLSSIYAKLSVRSRFELISRRARDA